jgi:hypothetical protein
MEKYRKLVRYLFFTKLKVANNLFEKYERQIDAYTDAIKLRRSNLRKN